MTIRPATREDLLWIRLLFSQLLDEHPLPYPIYGPPDLEAFTALAAGRLGMDPSLICYVAEEGPAVVGFIMAEIFHRVTGQPRRYAIVSWLYVVPSMRGRGIARAMSAAGLLEAKAKGVEAAELCTVPGDMQWARRGWIPVSVVFALPIQAIETTFITTSQPPNGGTRAPDLPPD